MAFSIGDAIPRLWNSPKGNLPTGPHGLALNEREHAGNCGIAFERFPKNIRLRRFFPHERVTLNG